MRRPLHQTTALPRELRNELGLKDRYGEKKRARNAPASRKDRRQAERATKSRRGLGSGKRDQRRFDEDEDDVGVDELEEEEVVTQPKGRSTKSEEKKPKSILKKPARVEESDPGSEEEYQPPKLPRTVQSKLDADDAEIAALEKKLGMKKGRKLPKSFMEDGLDDLLGDLGDGSGDENRKRKREADEWLLNKRRKAQVLQSDDESEDAGSDDGSDGSNGEDRKSVV